MDKYKIVPTNNRILAQLVKGMETTPEEEALLEQGFIRHVEISIESNTWEVLLWCQAELPEALLQKAGDYLAKGNKVAKVLFYPTILKLEKIVEQQWGQLV